MHTSWWRRCRVKSSICQDKIQNAFLPVHRLGCECEADLQLEAVCFPPIKAASLFLGVNLLRVDFMIQRDINHRSWPQNQSLVWFVGTDDQIWVSVLIHVHSSSQWGAKTDHGACQQEVIRDDSLGILLPDASGWATEDVNGARAFERCAHSQICWAKEHFQVIRKKSVMLTSNSNKVFADCYTNPHSHPSPRHPRKPCSGQTCCCGNPACRILSGSFWDSLFSQALCPWWCPASSQTLQVKASDHGLQTHLQHSCPAFSQDSHFRCSCKHRWRHQSLYHGKMEHWPPDPLSLKMHQTFASQDLTFLNTLETRQSSRIFTQIYLSLFKSNVTVVYPKLAPNCSPDSTCCGSTSR